jgi:signal transduction histidine kinase
MSLKLTAATPLGRLRLAFATVGTLMLVSVVALLLSALSRLEAQRSLRQGMVADRVFDEIEREIGTVLQHEAERSSEAYDAKSSDVRRWSRFVVGYYRRAPDLQLVAANSLPVARAALLRRIVEAAEPELSPARARVLTSAGAPEDVAGRSAPASQRAARSPDVLRLLNRGAKVREHRLNDFVEHFTVVRAGRYVIAERAGEADASRREGLVIDLPQLIDWTQEWVLDKQGLRAIAALTLTGATANRPANATQFHHALTAPFEGYDITLRLARLGDEDASSTLSAMTGLFGLAATLGLFAIYRMVEVQVRFAERRNNFVAAVTHELRTPLTSIRMYGEMLREGMVTDDATRQEYYATITAEGERLTRLINNVMEHGKLRRGQRHAHVAPGDVVSVVREVVELMRPHVQREGFALQLTAVDDLPLVQLDIDGLKQMLFNVIDNALKYGRADAGSKIEIACTAAADGGVMLSVRDHGHGVAEAQLHAVFEPFFRGESELTRRQQGTGLGLSLVRDLAELMRGSVRGINRAPGFEIQISLRAA